MSQNKEVIVSVHIEKNAGTTLQGVYEQAVGRRHVLLYNPQLDVFARSSDIGVPRTNPLLDKLKYRLGESPILPLLNRIYNLSNRIIWIAKAVNVEKIPADIRVVHGHFQATKLDGLVQSPLPVVVIREPYERTMSHFLHWQRSHGRADWRVQIPFDPELKPGDFAMLPQLRNYQSQSLDGKDLQVFGIVGLTESLRLFTCAILNRLATTAETKRLNVSPRPERLEPPNPEFLAAFRKQHADDYDLYRQAQSLVGERN